jgi:hypothetical protein
MAKSKESQYSDVITLKLNFKKPILEYLEKWGVN